METAGTLNGNSWRSKWKQLHPNMETQSGGNGNGTVQNGNGISQNGNTWKMETVLVQNGSGTLSVRLSVRGGGSLPRRGAA
eukprot:14069430-Alexandrium_andersonii.AAC.2